FVRLRRADRLDRLAEALAPHRLDGDDRDFLSSERTEPADGARRRLAAPVARGDVPSSACDRKRQHDNENVFHPWIFACSRWAPITGLCHTPLVRFGGARRSQRLIFSSVSVDAPVPRGNPPSRAPLA